MRAKYTLTTIWVLLFAFLAVEAWAAGPLASDALLPPGLVWAKTYQPGTGASVGKVASIRGQVVIVHTGDPLGYRAEANFAIYEKDLLVTREGARAVLELNDGSRISLAELTRLVIDRSVFNPADGTRESLLDMSLGKARFWVQKIVGSKRSSFQVRTETAIAGVRGSDFVVRSTRLLTEVVALENTRLEVSAAAAPEKALVLTDFQRTVVAVNQMPSAPEIVGPDEIERLKRAFPQVAGGADRAVGTTRVGAVVTPGVGRKERNVVSGQAGHGGAIVSGGVVNKASGKNVTNVAAGRNASASMGSVKIEGSMMKGSVINQSEARDAANSAVGSDSEANVGAVVVE
jgi:hypothetical protein